MLSIKINVFESKPILAKYILISQQIATRNQTKSSEYYIRNIENELCTFNFSITY